MLAIVIPNVRTSIEIISYRYIDKTTNWGANMSTGGRHICSLVGPSRQQPYAKPLVPKRKHQRKAVIKALGNSPIVSPKAI